MTWKLRLQLARYVQPFDLCLNPLAPCVPERDSMLAKLCPLRFENVTARTPSKRDLGLFLEVEFVKLSRESLPERAHISPRVESLPWLGADRAFARLGHENQRVETGHDRLQGMAEKRAGGLFVGVEQIS